MNTSTIDLQKPNFGGGYSDAPFVAEYYDHVVPYRNRADVQFFVEEAVSAHGPVLEIGCGTGRILIPTARAGVEITGLDFSTMMLDMCRSKLADEPSDVESRVTLVEGDMRSFDLKKQFALITTPFRGFQHLETVEDQMQCLQSIHRHLLPDGKLILDLFNPSILVLADPAKEEEYGEEPEFTMDDGRRVLRRSRFSARDYTKQLNHAELIYYTTYPDGRVERMVHRFAMRYLFRYEAEHLLARCGFVVEDVFGDYNREEFGTRYPGELIVVARKED